MFEFSKPVKEQTFEEFFDETMMLTIVIMMMIMMFQQIFSMVGGVFRVPVVETQPDEIDGSQVGAMQVLSSSGKPSEVSVVAVNSRGEYERIQIGRTS